MSQPSRIPFFAARTVGVLLLLATLMHFFGGFPAVGEMIQASNLSEDGARTFKIIWIFSSITMALMGAWTLFISGPLKNGSKSAWWQGLLIGFGLIFFGCVAQVFQFPNWGMFGFTFLGLLLFLPILITKSHF